MHRSGKYPPLIVTFDSHEGYSSITLSFIILLYLCVTTVQVERDVVYCCSYTVEADGAIKDLTIIAEYTGDVDYMKNREQDDCDSMMTLLLASDPSKSLLVCPDKRGNIARFISGINNYTP